MLLLFLDRNRGQLGWLRGGKNPIRNEKEGKFALWVHSHCLNNRYSVWSITVNTSKPVTWLRTKNIKKKWKQSNGGCECANVCYRFIICIICAHNSHMWVGRDDLILLHMKVPPNWKHWWILSYSNLQALEHVCVCVSEDLQPFKRAANTLWLDTA